MKNFKNIYIKKPAIAIFKNIIIKFNTPAKIFCNNSKSKNIKTIHAKTLNIFNRYIHNIDKIKDLIKFYLNYHKKDPEELKEIIFESLKVPKTISDILKQENGKFLRDIALELDERNNLLDL